MKMKKIAAWTLTFCLLFAGCQSTESAQAGQELPISTEEIEPILNERNEQLNQQVISAGRVEFRNGGRQRIPYTGAVSTVQYITSVEQLPNYEVFKQYDAEFFKENALVLVTQSTGSGSAQLEIESLLVENGEVVVKMKQTMPEGEGTMDMAAWLVWVEVDAGLDFQWKTDTTGKGAGLNIQTH